MLIMRFNRTGKKNRVSYRVVLQEHTAAPGKRHVEILGSHDPHTKTTVLKEDRIKHWLAEGVQTSDAVHNLLVRQGLITGDKKAKKMPRPVVKEPEVVEETASVGAPKPATEEATPATEAATAEPVTANENETAVLAEEVESSAAEAPKEVAA
jgi:small subunit ribosomal protein S16